MSAVAVAIAIIASLAVLALGALIVGAMLRMPDFELVMDPDEQERMALDAWADARAANWRGRGA